MISDRYSLDALVPKMLELYERTAAMKLQGWERTYPDAPTPPPRMLQPTTQKVHIESKKSPFAG